MEMELNKERYFSTLEQVTALLIRAKGKSFRELDKTGRSQASGNKGALGNIIEESVLHYPVNSDKEADIQVGKERYEIKVTPLKDIGKRNSSSVQTVAKERLVLDIINYCELPHETFETSTFWKKSKNIILIYYKDNRVNKKLESRIDCKVFDFSILQYTDADLAIIHSDWDFIRNKVASGEADKLSESDTNYLAAATKGSTAASSLRSAPSKSNASGEIQAKQRAFSFKSSYMTTVFNRHVGNVHIQSLPMTPEETLNGYVHSRLSKYVGSTVESISKQLNLTINNSKSFYSTLALQMLGATGNQVSEIEQFSAANVNQVKTIVLYNSGLPQENMSFPALTQAQWEEIGDKKIQWEDSVFYNFFEENKFLFVIFEASGLKRADTEKTSDILRGGFLWNMPESDINRFVHPVWDILHTLMVSKQSVHYYDNHNKLPGSSFNKVFHIRSHAKSGRDKILLPNGESITKQSFWLDKRYIAKLVHENLK